MATLTLPLARNVPHVKASSINTPLIEGDVRARNFTRCPTMTSHTHIPAVFIISLLCSACSGPAEPDWLYGEWNEALTGELVHFRGDRTVSWFGEEGTFEFGRSAALTSAFCSMGSTCPDGVLHIYVGDVHYRSKYYVEPSWGDTYSLRFCTAAGMVQSADSARPVQGKLTTKVILTRSRAFTGAYQPDGLPRFDTGLTNFYSSISSLHRVNGSLVASVTGGFALLDESSDTWSALEPEGDEVFTGSSCEMSSEVIVCPSTNHAYSYSTDTGATFQPLPDFENVIEGSSLSIGNDGSHFIGSTLYQTSPLPMGNESNLSPPTTFGLYAIDLSSDTPAWMLVHTFSEDISASSKALVSSERVNELYLSDCSEQCAIYHSTNGGSDWAQLTTVANNWVTIRPTKTGIVISYTADGSSTYAWYNAVAGAWTQHETTSNFSFSTVNGDTLVGVGPHDRNRIERLNPDGSIEILADLSSPESPSYDTALVATEDYFSTAT